MIDRYEYRVVEIRNDEVEATLNRFGKTGFRLVQTAVDGDGNIASLIMERPIERVDA